MLQEQDYPYTEIHVDVENDDLRGVAHYSEWPALLRRHGYHSLAQQVSDCVLVWHGGPQPESIKLDDVQGCEVAMTGGDWDTLCGLIAEEAGEPERARWIEDAVMDRFEELREWSRCA